MKKIILSTIKVTVFLILFVFITSCFLDATDTGESIFYLAWPNEREWTTIAMTPLCGAIAGGFVLLRYYDEFTQDKEDKEDK